jgi:endonuclease G
MSATSGKLALVQNSTAALAGECPLADPNVVDFVGYGTAATCYEGSGPAPTLGAPTAALRTRNGCKDTDFNNLNFTEVAPAPRNSFSPANVCPAGDFAPEVFSTDPANGGVNYPVASNVIVNFDTAVTVSDGGFTLSCTNSGAHTLTVTGGPVTFTLNPDTDFTEGEQCTATVLASHVTSQGTTPVSMVANYVWTFGTLIVRDPAEHMVMGNPSGAVTDAAVPLNYLMLKPQYALSYNNDKGTPNWTSWHLDSTWTTGVADRQNDFRPDTTLPAGFKQVASGYNFATYGFDRGHMVPSADRTSSEEDNSATFLMTNMVPQASGNNQGPWADMENDLRALLGGTSNELYILSGGHGVGGTSTTGNWDTITDTGGNTVTVPDLTWKVVMVMPRADGDDVARVNNATRTFAVIMPNNDDIRPDDWKKYLATVDQVEALTGYNFFSNVPEAIQNVIEAQLDGEYDTAPTADNQSVTTPEDTATAVTLSASDFNVNNVFTYTVVSGPSHGVLSGTGGELTYTPFADYHGPDAFTFKANDGAKDSNTATVNINVTPVNDAPTLTDVPASANIPELAAYTFTAQAGDVDGQALTFSLVGAPAGASIDQSGVFTWTPTEGQGGTGSPFSFTVRVTDGVLDTDSPVTITVGEVNQAPALAAIGSKVVLLGGTLTFTAVGADADLPAQGLSYSLTGSVPSGASIDPTSGVFTWTPTAAQAGQTYTFTVLVTDALGLSDDETISVGVGHNWSGVLQPINANGTSVFKLGRIVPIKFQLTGASAPLTDAVVRLYVAKVADSIVGTEEEADSTSNATEGNLFRYADGQYMFNWDTSGLSAGTYQLRFDMGDGVQRTALVSLR